jgi:hypothetical protein
MAVFMNGKGVLKCTKVTSKAFVGPVTGAVTGNLAGSPILPTYTVAQLGAAPMTPSAANAGMLVRCSNGNAGAACVAMSTGSAWVVIALGSPVAIA